MAWVVERAGLRGVTFKGCYRNPDGRERSAGTFPSRRAALRAAQREEQKVLAGQWHDAALGAVTFESYVENEWLPSKHIELSTRAGYRSNLDKHFLPFFGSRPMQRITPALVQDWVTRAVAEGLSPRSIRKYHVLLDSIFARAVRDRVLVTNPCDHTELPKNVQRRTHTLTPEEYGRLLAAIPAAHRLMIETSISTGVRWGELIALRPRHVDFLRRLITIEETIVEVTKKVSPTGERMVVKPYPKDDEARRIGVRQAWLDAVSVHIQTRGIERDELLFSTRAGTPISRNTFRSRVWLPAVAAAEISFSARIHDLRHAHASWLLAGGADLKGVMERMGHSQIQTTQRYLHTLPDYDDRNLDAFDRVAGRRPTPDPDAARRSGSRPS